MLLHFLKKKYIFQAYSLVTASTNLLFQG